MPKTRFLIACQPRTGSNWLCTLLQSHPQVLCHHEVFHSDDIYYAVGHRDGRLAHLGTTHQRDLDPQHFLEELWRADFGRAAVGIKLLEGQAPEMLTRLLAESSVKKLLLRRRSRVRAYVSLLRARETGHWARTPYDGLTVRVEAHELLGFARRYDEFYARLRSSTRSQPVLEVVYEDLQRDPREFARVLEFLEVGAPELALGASTMRQSCDSLREAIGNFDELALELSGTALEAELAGDAAQSAKGCAP